MFESFVRDMKVKAEFLFPKSLMKAINYNFTLYHNVKAGVCALLMDPILKDNVVVSQIAVKKQEELNIDQEPQTSSSKQKQMGKQLGWFSTPDEELKNYLSEPVISQESNAFEW
ncbi:hypothetical protein PR048_015357 [Dryococelus australis]|uniref:Uncharacterized protein n=1 Tax=Dryococelus australis TaxID=614101 RepID=A0ABQ9HGQ8_9NEOP|nr:hypothetical protein PR048_015357 [Dryococelus australis]